ncbi:MAG: zinc-binding alcohol dehydrogenase family protein [Saprospiraceae bacterium]
MKAISCIKPGLLQYVSLPEPTLKDGHSLVKINRIGICGTDIHAYKGNQPYFTYPRILGHELSGTILEASNPNFSIGDQVTIIPYLNCGKCIACRSSKPNCCTHLKVMGVHVDGGMLEVIAAPHSSLLIENELSFEELALIEPLAIGAHGIGRADIKPNEWVLILGAGPIGLGLMNLAKISGARVIALDTNDYRLKQAQSIAHVDHVIPPSVNTFEELKELTDGDMPTIIIDATGNLQAINNAFQYLAHGGKYILVGLQKEFISFSHPAFHKREATLMSSRNATRADFEYVIKCIKSGLISPLQYITHRVSFENMVSDFESLIDIKNGMIKGLIEL